jgi:hypothetical protein
MFSKRAISKTFNVYKFFMLAILLAVSVAIYQEAQAEGWFMRAFAFSMMGLVIFLGVVVAHLRPFAKAQTEDSSKIPNEYSDASFRHERLNPNDPCPCGSGKKYKHCCKAKADALEAQETEEEAWGNWGRLVQFYGGRAMEEGHDGPLWFSTLMRRIYYHPWLSWVAVVIVIGTAATYFLTAEQSIPH